jgi:CRP-like cAMP-binding protein
MGAVKVFKKGEVIFKEGDLENCMYNVISGCVGIYANYGKEDEKLLVDLKAGEKSFFGEMGMIDGEPRSATAVAIEDTEASVITSENFADFFKEHPEHIFYMMQNMSKRIRGLTVDYLDACRAVAEAVETEKNGKSKSDWFKDRIVKFINDYNQSGLRSIN